MIGLSAIEALVQSKYYLGALGGVSLRFISAIRLRVSVNLV
jgi:hypothetical protein